MTKVTKGVMTSVALMLGLSLTAEAHTSEFPSSTTPTTSEWGSMHPSSFEGTIDSAFAQCERAEKDDPADRLTEEKCVTFKHQLEHGMCRLVWVPDGIGFDFMNGLINGRSGLTRNVRKKIGRQDRARICDLGDGVHAYWFYGDEGKSCNNVGIVIVEEPPIPELEPVPVKEETPLPAPEKELEWICTITHYNSERGEQHIHFPGIIVPGCTEVYIPGQTFSFGGGSSRGYSPKCGWFPVKKTEE